MRIDGTRFGDDLFSTDTPNEVFTGCVVMTALSPLKAITQTVSLAGAAGMGSSFPKR